MNTILGSVLRVAIITLHLAGMAAAAPMVPLKVSDNGRFLVRADGAPFFWLGDTAWELRTLKPDEVEFYMANRVRHGFNVIQVCCGYDATDHAGNRPYHDGNTDTPDEAFWVNMDAIVHKAQQHGLYVALVPMWGLDYAKAVGSDAEKARRLGRWIARRYVNETNVLWIVSGEYDSINGYKLPISAAQKRVLQAVAKGLWDGHRGAQLMTIHPGVACTSSRDFHNETWLGFNMLQSGHVIEREAYKMAEVHALIAHDYHLTPIKPVLDGEPFYEDTPDAVWTHKDINRPRGGADVIRRKAYWAVFAGAFGHTYGHNDVYCFFEPKHPGDTQTLPKGPGQRGSWRKSLDAPGATQMKHLRALMESRPFLSRIPDQSILASAAGTGAGHIQATGISHGSCFLVYLPMGGTVTVDLSRITGGKVRAWWYDPRNGKATAIGEFAGNGKREFTSPDAGKTRDWVLTLDDATKGFPPPGPSQRPPR